MPLSMPPKTTPMVAPLGSKELVNCFYFDKTFEKHYLKTYTNTIHKGCPVKEKLLFDISCLVLFIYDY